MGKIEYEFQKNPPPFDRVEQWGTQILLTALSVEHPPVIQIATPNSTGSEEPAILNRRSFCTEESFDSP